METVDRYRQMYHSKKHKFRKELIHNVIQGAVKEETTLEQLWVLKACSEDGRKFVRDLRHKDETILNLAAKFDEGFRVLEAIIDICPSLLTVSRKGAYEGQTALHIVISKRNIAAVACLLEECGGSEVKGQVLRTAATGSRFAQTIMMGELPFSVAALTLDLDVLDVMYHHGNPDMASFRNSRGDTIFHSLIRYARLQPNKIDEVIAVCEVITQRLNSPSDQADPTAVWFLQNDNKQTALQLSAALEQVELFRYILEIENVYRRLDNHDGLFDIHLYDITEIDTVSATKPTSGRGNKAKKSRVVPEESGIEISTEMDDDRTESRKGGGPKITMGKPVLETMCEINVHKAFELLNLKVMSAIIKEKWSRYRWVYYTWAFFHLAYMCTLTYYAVVKTEQMNQQLSGDTEPKSGNSSPETTSHSTSFYQCVYTCVKNVNTQLEPNSPNQQAAIASIPKNENKVIFITITPWTNIFISVWIIFFEIRRLYRGHRFHFMQIHHNGTYRLLLCVFSVCLIADSVWFLVRPENNYFLIGAILVGWWFLTFFLRAFKKFGFFTVMLQKVLHGDAVRFVIIIFVEFLAFTMAMYVTFLDNRRDSDDNDDFSTVWRTALTLFNLMLGLSELEALTEARDPWLAIGLFVAFVLLTYVLMLNALVAMMSQTCAAVSGNKVVQGELQRLSVIVFLEDVLPHGFKVGCGTRKHVKHYDFAEETIVQEERSFLEIDSLQTSYSKGSAIVEGRDNMQTKRFSFNSKYGWERPNRTVNRDSTKVDVSERNPGRNLNRFIRPREGGSSPIPRKLNANSSKPRKSSMKKRKRGGDSAIGSSRGSDVKDEDNEQSAWILSRSHNPQSIDITDGLHISTINP